MIRGESETVVDDIGRPPFDAVKARLVPAPRRSLRRKMWPPLDDLCPTGSRTALAQAMREITQIGLRIGTYAARTYGPSPVGGVVGDRGFGGTIPRSMA